MTTSIENQIKPLIAASGFNDYRIIDAKIIEVAQWVRVKCTFGCSDYGLATCPPNTPTVDECKQFFSEYNKAALIRLNVFADKDHYPSEWSKEMTNQLLNLEKRIFLSAYPKAFLFNQTCCGICKECIGTRLNCIDKSRSRPSPEAFAVDVYQTVRNAGMEINVISENPSEINRYALLMIE